MTQNCSRNRYRFTCQTIWSQLVGCWCL